MSLHVYSPYGETTPMEMVTAPMAMAGGAAAAAMGVVRTALVEKDRDSADARAGHAGEERRIAAAAPPDIKSAGRRFARTREFRYLVGLDNKGCELMREISDRDRATWGCLTCAPGSSTIGQGRHGGSRFAFFQRRRWRPRCTTARRGLHKEVYALLATIRHRLLLRMIGYRRRRRIYRQPSDAHAFKMVTCQNVEVIVRQRRLHSRGGVPRQLEERLPKRLKFGTLLRRGDSGQR